MGDFLGDAHLISRPRTGGFGPAQKKRRGRRIHATPVETITGKRGVSIASSAIVA
jgi:hypothetical protein